MRISNLGHIAVCSEHKSGPLVSHMWWCKVDDPNHMLMSCHPPTYVTDKRPSHNRLQGNYRDKWVYIQQSLATTGTSMARVLA